MRVAAGIALVALLSASCGGGPVPASLREPRIEVAAWKPSKTLFVRDAGLNLVTVILPISKAAAFLVVGNTRTCKVPTVDPKPACSDLAADLWNLDVVTSSDGEPAAIVGSGGWGRPSAALLDMTGRLKWKYDGGYDVMGPAAVLDDGNNRFVVVSSVRQGLLFLDFESGKIVRTGTSGDVLAAADFEGNGRREVLLSPSEDVFVISSFLDGKEIQLAGLRVSKAYWHRPAVTPSRPPFVVLSAGNVLDVYDSQLKFAKRFDARGAASPLHVTAATFIGKGPEAPFAALYKGRGGWHRSILYVFSKDGELVYEEILGDDYQCITPLEESGQAAFLVGGRGEVWLYRFPKKM